MHQHSERATMNLPPMFPTDLLPCDLCSFEEMEMLKRFLSSTLRTKGPEEFEKATKTWTPEMRAEVARILGDLRERGFYPDRIDGDGRVVWGVVQKGAVQMLMERKTAEYERKGAEVRRRNGSFLRSMNENFETRGAQ